MMRNCPARNEATITSRPIRALGTPSSEATTSCGTSRIPQRNARVNAIGAASPNSAGASGSGSGGASGGSADRTDSEEHYNYDRGVPNDDAPEPFTNYEEACLNLLQIEVPDREETPNNLFTFDCYRRAVHAIRDNPNASSARHCIVCRGQHHFENCPTLNDNDFLKQHYVHFCQNVRRDQVELSHQRGEQVNFMDRTYFDDSDSEDNDRDFLHGHR